MVLTYTVRRESSRRIRKHFRKTDSIMLENFPAFTQYTYMYAFKSKTNLSPNGHCPISANGHSCKGAGEQRMSSEHRE